jgi:hypothetical protein
VYGAAHEAIVVARSLSACFRAGEHVADPDTKAGLVAVAKAIDPHIESGVDKMRRT